MSQMLEQAIIDAKALKEAAFNSAKDQLLEKYAPQIKEAVDSILEQEGDEEQMSDLMGSTAGMGPDQGNGEMSGLTDEMPLAATDGEKLCPCPDDEEEIEIDFAALEKQMSGMGDEEQMGHDQLATDVGMAPEEEFELSEYELYEMLSSELGEEESVEEAVKLSPEYMKAKKEREASKKKEKEESGSELKESTDSSIKVDNAVLKETKKAQNKLLTENKKLLSENKQLVKENKDLKNILSEVKNRSESFKAKIIELSETLGDINLKNAKLHYECQVLKSASLNERQKIKIVEAISRAGSVEETKAIYETLIDSVGTSSERKSPQSLKEVVSKNRVFVANQPKAINPERNRWQALAGIKK